MPNLKQSTVQNLIEESSHFRPIRTGWIVGKCPCCNDYKERAGFKFENGECIYNCWNCNKSGRYEEFSGKMTRNFRSILLKFGIDEDEISLTVNSAFFFKKPETAVISLSELNKIDTNAPEIKLPPNTFKLGHNGFIPIQEKIVDYIASRHIDLEKYNFYFSLEERLLNRVIIPYYRNGKLIYWQARSILKNEKKRYENSPVKRDSVLFNTDELYSFDTRPLFITEGVFDAMLVDGVCLLGSVLNANKLELLSRSRRRLIFVIDKDANGKSLAEEVLKHGWEIAFVPNGAEDISDSVDRFGLSWTIYELMKSIPSDRDRARLKIKINCR